MSPLIATAIYGIGICIVLLLDRDRRSRTSAALWLPIVWLLISGSRPVSAWIYHGSTATPEQLLDGSPVDAAVRLAIILAGVIVLVRRKKTVAAIVQQNTPLLLFLAYCLLSTIWSDYTGVALKRWIRLLGDFTTVLIVLSERDRSGAIRRVLSCVGIVLIPSSILLDKYYPDLGRYYDTWSGRMFFSGVAADKNMLGMTCLVYGVVAVWGFVTTCKEPKGRGRMRRLVAQAMIVAMVLYLFRDADSMTSESCFIMASTLIVLTTFWRTARKPLFVHLMVAAMVGLSFATLFLHLGNGAALRQMGRNPTLTGRTEIWAGLLRFSGNPLIGTGFDSFWLGTRMERIWAAGGQLYGINEAHDGYLETYLNLGWVGVALLASLIVTGYRNIQGALRFEPETGRIRLGLFVAVIIYSFTEAGFRTNSSVWIAFLFAIAAVPLLPKRRIEARPASRRGRSPRITEESPVQASPVEQLVPRSLAQAAIPVLRQAT